MVATGWVVVQSTWLKRKLDGIFKRVHLSREREREREERGIQEDGAFQEREEKLRGRGEVCPGYLPSAFRHHPINKSTCHVQSHCPNFTFSCKVSF